MNLKMNLKMNLIISLAFIVIQMTFITALQLNYTGEQSTLPLKNHHLDFDEKIFDNEENLATVINNFRKINSSIELHQEADKLMTYVLNFCKFLRKNVSSQISNSSLNIRRSRSIQPIDTENESRINFALEKLRYLETEVELLQRSFDNKNVDLNDSIEVLKEEVIKLMHTVNDTKQDLTLLKSTIEGQKNINEEDRNLYENIFNDINEGRFKDATSRLSILPGSINENIKQFLSYKPYSFKGHYYTQLYDFATQLFFIEHSTITNEEVKLEIFQALHNELQRASKENSIDFRNEKQPLELRIMQILDTLLFNKILIIDECSDR